MDLREYQRRAAQNSQLRHGGPQAAVAPLLGLAAETGSILNAYKRYLRDGVDLTASQEALREELGDLLWYAAAAATECGLDLAEVAVANPQRTQDIRVNFADLEHPANVSVLDHDFPPHERFPRRLVVEFHRAPAGRCTNNCRTGARSG